MAERHWIKSAIKHPGAFTATKKRTGKTTEELTHSTNPTTRRRANLAQTLGKLRKG